MRLRSLPSLVVAVVCAAACASSSKPPASPAEQLAAIPVQGRAPKTGYTRARFGPAWADVDHNGCDTRNDVLNRDLTNKQWRSGTHNCVVVAGTLADPYTGATMSFAKARAADVQIDHIVALSDSWQTGAAEWTDAQRERFANDPDELLAVDGKANEAKGDGDAATWLPPNKAFRCEYARRQVAIKRKYYLWVTQAEHDALARLLATC